MTDKIKLTPAADYAAAALPVHVHLRGGLVVAIEAAQLEAQLAAYERAALECRVGRRGEHECIPCAKRIRALAEALEKDDAS